MRPDAARRRAFCRRPYWFPRLAVPGSLTWIGRRMNAEQQQKIVHYLNEAEAGERALVRCCSLRSP